MLSGFASADRGCSASGGETLLEGITAGGPQATALVDAASARAAMAAAGTLPELDAALRQAAAVFTRRFGASYAAIVVQPPAGRPRAVAINAAGNDSEPLRDWLETGVAPFRQLMAATPAIIPDVRAIASLAGVPQSLLPEVRAVMHIPLLDDAGRPLGLALAAAPAPGAFHDQHLAEFQQLGSMLSALAGRSLLPRIVEPETAIEPLALVIEHAELLAQAERQRRSLAVTAEILRAMATSGDSAGAFDAIATILSDFFAADAVVLASRCLESGRTSVLGCSVPADPASARQLAQDLAMGFRDLDPASAPAATGPAPHSAVARAAAFTSTIAISFPLANIETGIVIVARGQQRPYGPADDAQLGDISGALALAIDRVRLVANMEDSGRTLAAQTHVLAALGPGATIEGVGEIFVLEARRLFGATHALVARLARAAASVVALSSDHLTADELYFPHGSDPAAIEPYASVLRGEPQIVGDLEIEARSTIERKTLRAGVRSLMRVPIRDSAGVVSGLVTLGHPEPNRWDERDVAALVELSSALGLVSERAALLTAADERAARVSTLTRLLSTFNASARPEEVARLFAAEVRRLLGADVVLVHAFDHDAGTRVRIAADFDSSFEPVPLPKRNLLAESSTYQGVLDTPRAHFDARNPEAAPAWLRESAATFGLGNLIIVRLDASGVPVGMIAAGSREPGRLQEGELHILTEVAAPLTMLLERARVVTSLQRQTQRTRAILDILAALGPRDSLADLAAPLASALRTMYGAEHCVIATIEGERIALAAIDSDLVDDWQPGTSAALAVAQLPRRLLSEGLDVTSDFSVEPPESLSRQGAALRRAGLRSSIRVTIGPPAAPLGLVTVGSRVAARYSDADARELIQIVQPLGVAISYFKGRLEAEKRTLRLEYTNRILVRLSGGGSVEHLAAGFLAECRTLFRCAHSVAMLTGPDAASVRVLACDSDLDEPLVPFARDSDPGTAPPFDTPAPRVLADARTSHIASAQHPDLIEAGLFCSIDAPLIVHDRVRGVVSLWAHGAGAYTEEDADLLATLTRPLAIALEKADAVTSLGESELKYRSLVSQAEEMIFLFDSQSLAILDANAYTARTLGYSGGEIRQMCLTDLVAASPEDVAEAVQRTLENGEFHVGDRVYVRQDGSRIDVDEVASVVSYGGRQAILVLARDVSERKAIQRQLVQAQKMESLGSMAGAVAHDFNNLLTTILGFAGLLKRSTNLDAEERENLGLIEDAARRAADLTGRLLAFARGGLVRVGPVDLRTVVADTMHLAEPGLHAGIRATTRLPGAAVMVEGDGGQLQLSLLNIVLNARDAMPDGGSIDVDLRADNMTATITIADNGPGMDDETRVRIFEPFYTTKPLGSGTGLGMAITYGIIQGHHGSVGLQTSLGKGTTFTITLPLLPGAEELLPGNAYNAGEGNLVLVVDDDELVRRATSATLAQLGYNVVEAPGGATAVEIIRARPDRFSVVLLDLVMPGMTGSETFRALTEIRPDLPVVVCTGYAADAHIDQDVKRRIAGLVQKPFSSERLGRALSAAGALPSRPPM